MRAAHARLITQLAKILSEIGSLGIRAEHGRILFVRLGSFYNPTYRGLQLMKKLASVGVSSFENLVWTRVSKTLTLDVSVAATLLFHLVSETIEEIAIDYKYVEDRSLPPSGYIEL